MSGVQRALEAGERGTPMIRIQQVSNGYIVTDTDDPESQPSVIQQREDESDARAFLALVREVQDRLGQWGSRHDAERFYADVRPGDKYADAHGLTPPAEDQS